MADIVTMLSSGIPLSVAVVLALIGGLQAIGKIKLIPHPMMTNRVAWAVFLIGLVSTAGTLGWVSGFAPADQSNQGEFQYSISPSAVSGVSYDSNSGAFSTTQVYNASSDSLQTTEATMEFSVSRSDQVAEESVFTVQVQNNPTVENESTGETYQLFETTSDDKAKVEIRNSDGYAYESRTMALEAGSSATFNVTAHLNNDFVQHGLNAFPDEPYESDQAVISVAGNEYTYKEVLEQVNN